MSDSFATTPRLDPTTATHTIEPTLPPRRPYGYISSRRLTHPPPIHPHFLRAHSPFNPPTVRQVVSLLPTPRCSTSTNPCRLFPYSSLHPRRSQDPGRGGYEPESRLPRPRKPQLLQDCTQWFSTATTGAAPWKGKSFCHVMFGFVDIDRRD